MVTESSQGSGWVRTVAAVSCRTSARGASADCAVATEPSRAGKFRGVTPDVHVSWPGRGRSGARYSGAPLGRKRLRGRAEGDAALRTHSDQTTRGGCCVVELGLCPVANLRPRCVRAPSP